MNAPEEFQQHVAAMLRQLDPEPDREGLRDTPRRVQKAFEAETDEMVLVKNIELYSLCEHHLAPFFGKAHVAYIPSDKIIGLSKIARIVDIYARRLQVQERLTMQIAAALEDVMQPRGVGVVIEASHLCMMMRGVEKQNSSTVTSCLRGLFRRDERTRTEFLKLVRDSRS
jgi:GTP cyclohydrolase I